MKIALDEQCFTAAAGGYLIFETLLNESSATSNELSAPATLSVLLDGVATVLESPESTAADGYQAVDQLFHGLKAIRHAVTTAQWREMIQQGRAHRICSLVHQDPFTSRAFKKPRGYAGDAVMMDYIYGREENWEQPESTAVGSVVFDYTTSAPASSGVRERRCFVANLLDSLASGRDDLHVLAVAAGHLREASLSSGLRRGRFARFVAMDADQVSLAEIDKQYGRYGVETEIANIRNMLTGKLDLGAFDLIYTTGLYDYLAESTAKRLTANLFDCVVPGGKLVIANFLPNVRDIAYMEMFMDWHLVYRSRAEMLILADKISQPSIRQVQLTTEENENVVVMEITKR